MKVLVFDIGGTEVKHSVIDENINITEQSSFPTPESAQTDDENVRQKEYDHFMGLLEGVYRKYENEVEGIAMSLPGFIDMKNGRQCGGGALLYIIRRNMAEDLSKRCGGVKVRMANDAKCATLAENRSGSLKGCHNAGVFIIGTGVGGGLIINDRIINGPHFTAGEFSFLRMNITGDWTDRRNTMGDTGSTTGLLLKYKKFKKLPEDYDINGREFFAKYESGELEAVYALKAFCRDVAWSIQNINFMLDLEKVAVGGGISAQKALIDGICKAMEDLKIESADCVDPNMPWVEIVPCKYRNEANQIGAYHLFFEDLD